MKLGAQLFSLRDFIKTPEDIRTTFQRVKAMGFENVQFSGGGPIDAHELKAISEETGLDIVCTHSSFDRILNDTEALIEEHKIFGCPVIGLGSMPKEYRKGEKDLMSFFEDLKEPVQKILDSGKSVLTTMDISGAMSLKTYFKNVTTIYIKRDKKKLMGNILRKNSSIEDKVNRLIAIESENKNAEICDYVVPFDTYEEAARKICDILNV